MFFIGFPEGKRLFFLLVPSKNKPNQILIFHMYLVISNLSPSVVITIDKHYLNDRKKKNKLEGCGSNLLCPSRLQVFDQRHALLYQHNLKKIIAKGK